jgi:hypothetical protein
MVGNLISLQDKFIAYVDILGYTYMRDSAIAGTGLPLQELDRIRDLLCKASDKSQYKMDGPTICHCSSYSSRDLDFVITHEPDNDCSLISTEVSPAGVINLISHCSKLVLRLAFEGILCRGYIATGPIYHTDNEYAGPGLDTVLSKEKQVRVFQRHADDLGTPYVEVDQIVAEYVNSTNDDCIKKIFLRLVKEDGDSVALFPFKRLVFSTMLLDKMDIVGELQSVANTRSMLVTMKKRVGQLIDITNQKAIRKCRHYIEALDEQLGICDEHETFLRTMYPSL